MTIDQFLCIWSDDITPEGGPPQKISPAEAEARGLVEPGSKTAHEQVAEMKKAEGRRARRERRRKRQQNQGSQNQSGEKAANAVQSQSDAAIQG